jgi:tRNA(Arg) A34 adenosine deaminase TadA
MHIDILNYIILYYIVLYYIILYCIVLCCIILYIYHIIYILYISENDDSGMNSNHDNRIDNNYVGQSDELH